MNDEQLIEAVNAELDRLQGPANGPFDPLMMQERIAEDCAVSKDQALRIIEQEARNRGIRVLTR